MWGYKRCGDKGTLLKSIEVTKNPKTLNLTLITTLIYPRDQDFYSFFDFFTKNLFKPSLFSRYHSTWLQRSKIIILAPPKQSHSLLSITTKGTQIANSGPIYDNFKDFRLSSHFDKTGILTQNTIEKQNVVLYFLALFNWPLTHNHSHFILYNKLYNKKKYLYLLQSLEESIFY